MVLTMLDLQRRRHRDVSLQYLQCVPPLRLEAILEDNVSSIAMEQLCDSKLLNGIFAFII
jgi:hypothetical protein